MITYLSPSPPQVSDLMVMDVWQASLMRAFAQQVQREQQAGAGGEGQSDDGGSSDEEGWEEEGEEQTC